MSIKARYIGASTATIAAYAGIPNLAHGRDYTLVSLLGGQIVYRDDSDELWEYDCTESTLWERIDNDPTLDEYARLYEDTDSL